jgi:hypothetical protein
VNREKVVTLLLVGFGILGILYYLGKKKPLAAPGAGGPAVNAGGAGITPAVQSASAGVSGSIPNIIASAAALTGQTFGSVFSRQTQLAGISPKPGTLEPSTFDPGSVLIDTTSNLPAFQPLQLVPSGVMAANTSPLGTDFGPDVAGFVSALDVGGTDYSTLVA